MEMGRIRKTLSWTLLPGGGMHGPVRAESSAEQAAREAAEAHQAHAEARQAEIREQNRLRREQSD